MKEENAPTTEVNASQPAAFPASNYRPAVLLAFFACFLWPLLLASGWLDGLPLPTEVCVVLGPLVPVLAATAILYPSALFRSRQPALRMVMLFGLGFVLLVVAFALWIAFSFVLFGLGVIGPD